MIIDLKGEYIGGPRCGERFPIGQIKPPITIETTHPDSRFAGSGPYFYHVTLSTANGVKWDGKTYYYHYVKPIEAGV